MSEVKSLTCVLLFAIPWTVDYQAPPMGFSRQEHWSGLPLPPPMSKVYWFVKLVLSL